MDNRDQQNKMLIALLVILCLWAITQYIWTPAKQPEQKPEQKQEQKQEPNQKQKARMKHK